MQIALTERGGLGPIQSAVAFMNVETCASECCAHGIQAVDIVKAALADVQTQLLCKFIENVWIGFEGQPSLAHAVYRLQCTLLAQTIGVSVECNEAS